MTFLDAVVTLALLVVAYWLGWSDGRDEERLQRLLGDEKP